MLSYLSNCLQCKKSQLAHLGIILNSFGFSQAALLLRLHRKKLFEKNCNLIDISFDVLRRDFIFLPVTDLLFTQCLTQIR